MRKLLIIFAVIFQLLLLTIMAGERECVLRTGKIVYLRTVPVDPMDYFRGDYVRLNYEISSIKYDKLRDGLKNLKLDSDEKDRRVYVVLEVDEQNIANILYASDQKPQKGELFIRGRINYKGKGRINVRYGIESYFLEQNAGKDMESMKFKGHRASLEMAAALGNNGIAVIKDCRWAAISIEIEDLKLEGNRPQKAKVVLTNISEKPMAVIDLPDYHSLLMEKQMFGWRWIRKNWEWVTDSNTAYLPEDKYLHILEPNESYVIEVDFKDPYWSVSLDDEEQKLASEYEFEGSSFRIVYAPPSVKECENLKNSDLIWHGKVSSISIPTPD